MLRKNKQKLGTFLQSGAIVAFAAMILACVSETGAVKTNTSGSGADASDGACIELPDSCAVFAPSADLT